MKRLNKFLVVILSIALVATLFAGCSKNKNSSTASSFGDVYKTISEMKQYDYKTTIEVESDDPETLPNMEIVLYGTNDSDSSSLSLDISASGLNFSFEDVLIVSGDQIYLNIGEILDKIGSFMALAGVDTTDIVGSDVKWISIPSIDYTKYDTSDIQSSFAGYIDEILSDMNVTEDDGTFTVSIKDTDTLAKFLQGVKECIDTNGDALAEAYSKMVSADDISNLVTKYMELVSDALVTLNDEYDVDISEDDMLTEDTINEALGEMGLDTLEEDTKNSLTDSFKELSDSLDEAVNELNDSEEEIDFELKMSAGCSGDKATTEVKFSGTDDEMTLELTVTSEITANSDASVDVPSDSVSDLSESFPDIIYSLYSMEQMDSIIDDSIADDYDLDDFDYEEESTTAIVPLEEPGVAPIYYDDSTCSLHFDETKADYDEDFSSPDYGNIVFDDLIEGDGFAFVYYQDEESNDMFIDSLKEYDSFTTASGFTFDVYGEDAVYYAISVLDNGNSLLIDGSSFADLDAFLAFVDGLVQDIVIE